MDNQDHRKCPNYFITEVDWYSFEPEMVSLTQMFPQYG